MTPSYHPPTIIESRDVDADPRHGTVTERRPGFVVTEYEGGADESPFEKGMKWEMEHGPPTAGLMQVGGGHPEEHQPDHSDSEVPGSAHLRESEDGCDDPGWTNAEVADGLDVARMELMANEDFEPDDVAFMMKWAALRLRTPVYGPLGYVAEAEWFGEILDAHGICARCGHDHLEECGEAIANTDQPGVNVPCRCPERETARDLLADDEVRWTTRRYPEGEDDVL